MVEELKFIEDNKTWSLVEMPQDKKEIDLQWVYKVMLNEKGKVTKHKERLIEKGIYSERRN